MQPRLPTNAMIGSPLPAAPCSRVAISSARSGQARSACAISSALRRSRLSLRSMPKNWCVSVRPRQAVSSSAGDAGAPSYSGSAGGTMLSSPDCSGAVKRSTSAA